MMQIRIPVSMGHVEAGWFGYLHMWQCQPNGAIGTRLEMNDPRDSSLRGMRWEETIGADALGPDHHLVPLEEDSMGVMIDHYPHLSRVGAIQHKIGKAWV